MERSRQGSHQSPLVMLSSLLAALLAALIFRSVLQRVLETSRMQCFTFSGQHHGPNT